MPWSGVRLRFLPTLLALVLIPLLSGEETTPATSHPPKLVLQITVDQLRGDLLARYRDKFGPGGFRFLLEQGAYFANAHYETSNTFTASGHAVLVTGADTSEHGIVANDWWDRATGKSIYCTADARYPIVGEPPKPGAGQSPATLLSTTIGDEIVTSGAGRSRAFAVAGKDRSAIIPGGHLGKAFWWSEKTGGFATSTYYFPALPAWVQAWNETKPCEPYRTREWTPLHDPSTYRFFRYATNSTARPDPTLGRAFPHPLVAKSDALFFTAFRYTPFSDEVTAAFARELITQEKLGQGPATDYLSISFSGHDYIGHAYGPDSMEAEDALLRLDATLADLLSQIQQTIGFGNVIIVLSGDHGVDEIPESRRARGFSADRIYPEKIRAAANAALQRRFGIAEDLVAGFVPPGFYLDTAKVAAAKLDLQTVQDALAAHLRTVPGIAYAITHHDLLVGSLPHSAIFDRARRGFHAARSGDVVIIQEQFWYLYPDAEIYAAMHGSPYSYDTFVPIVMLVPGATAQTNYTAVTPAQIAATLAALLRINAPSGCAAPVPLPGVLK